MPALPETPVIPDETLRQLWEQDDVLREVHEKLASTSLSDFMATMPGVTRPSSRDMADGYKSSYVDLVPQDYDTDAPVVVMSLPWNNGWKPHMALRTALLQQSLEEPTRFVVFPNGRDSFHLRPDEQSEVASGDFMPIAAQQIRTLTEVGITKVRYIGYSQGASVGMAAINLVQRLGYTHVDKAGLFEPPNVLERSSKKLRQAFTAGGTSAFNKAVNDSAVPALTEAQHAQGGLDSIKQAVGFMPMLFPRAVDKSIKDGFCHPTFQEDLRGALMLNQYSWNDAVELLIAGARNSRIMPPAVAMEIADNAPSNVTAKVFEGYGHEMGDNIVAFALIGKMALVGEDQEL